MASRVVILASGETERRCLPILLADLAEQGVSIAQVRVPPGHRALTLEMAVKLIKATWFELLGTDRQPEKFVVLLDTDARQPDQVLKPFRRQLAGRLGDRIAAALQFAYAQRHLEAWFFADVTRLRDYLGRAPGVDTSNPDAILNPKQHLKDLLGERVYTAVIAEQIAQRLDPGAIAEHSASFRVLRSAVQNGNAGSTR